MNNQKISVIVPVYNVQHYLSKCLDSIINQTYKNLEIICINDESPDNSHLILDEYSQRDPRIRILNQKNTGVSSARNKGIDAATGDYIMFIDSDDWINLKTCEVTINIALKENVDVVLWPYIREFPNNPQPKRIFEGDFIYFSDIDVKQKLHRRFCGLLNDELSHPENADAIVTVWGKLYKSELIKKNNVKFVDTKLIGTAEDALFNFYLFNYVSSAVYINEYFSHYRKDNLTSITTRNKPNLYEQWKYLFDLMQRNIDNNKLDASYKQALDNRIALSIIGLGLNELASKTPPLEKIKSVKRIITSERYSSAYKRLTLKYFPIHWKTFFSFAKSGFATGLYMLLSVINKIIK